MFEILKDCEHPEIYIELLFMIDVVNFTDFRLQYMKYDFFIYEEKLMIFDYLVIELHKIMSQNYKMRTLKKHIEHKKDIKVSELKNMRINHLFEGRNPYDKEHMNSLREMISVFKVLSRKLT